MEASVATVLLSGVEWRVVVAWGHDMMLLPLQAVLYITPSTLEVDGFCSGGDVVVSLDLEAETIDVELNDKVVLRLVATMVEMRPLWGCPAAPCLPHRAALGESWE